MRLVASNDQANTRMRRLDLLSDFAARLLEGQDPDREALPRLFEGLSAELGVDASFGYILAEIGRGLRLAFYHGLDPEIARSSVNLDFGQAVCGTVAGTEQAIYVPHVQSTTGMREALIRSAGIRAYASEPLRAGGKLLGTLSFGSRTRDEFDDEDLLFFQAVARHVALARQRAEHEAERMEDATRLRMAQEAAGAGTWEVDLTTGVCTLSPESARMHGLPSKAPAVFPNDRWPQLIHPADRPGATEALRRAICDDGLYDVTFRVVKPDGDLTWAQGLGRVHRDTEGRPQRMVGLNIDVTAQKTAEASLREQEAFLRSVLDASGDCIKVVELDGSLSYMNINGQCAMEIDDFDAVAGADWSSLWPADCAPLVKQSVEDGRAGRSSRFEAYCPTAKGTPKWWDVSVAPILGMEGVPSRIVSVSRDVTERKLQEEALRESESVAARRLAELETLYNGAPIGMSLVDTDLRFVRVNAALAEIDGVPVEDHLGRTVREVVPALADQLEPLYRQVLETGESVRSLEIVGETPAEPGARRNWLASYDAVGSPDGSVIGINCVVREVTKRKRAEEQLALMNAELHHRVKNTLATVQAIANSTLRRAKDLPTFAQTFGARLSALGTTHALLVAGRGSSDLRELLCAELKPYDIEDGERLVLDGPDLDLPSAIAVPLGMAVHELTTNAVKYGALSVASGRVIIRWLLTHDADGRQVELEWRETGGPPVERPTTEGFGSQLLRRVFSSQPDARIERHFEPSGIRVNIRLPLA